MVTLSPRQRRANYSLPSLHFVMFAKHAVVFHVEHSVCDNVCIRTPEHRFGSALLLIHPAASSADRGNLLCITSVHRRSEQKRRTPKRLFQLWKAAAQQGVPTRISCLRYINRSISSRVATKKSKIKHEPKCRSALTAEKTRIIMHSAIASAGENLASSLLPGHMAHGVKFGAPEAVKRKEPWHALFPGFPGNGECLQATEGIFAFATMTYAMRPRGTGRNSPYFQIGLRAYFGMA
ncbi:hypothetical protein B0T14DRAFT_203258 [Immersiella caudata]|uniref:Uncharacterized protein n=1 Tax=Immersiella caudata TaxID=314043 RepID=A0AA40BZL1_9PEZI|nr:hypothetical protein B0T14DRAFT_203258 [Immersiella caudata]